ncbi:cytochrome P450 2F5-like [Diceros bicornis minor]|uniref:cytochrome P450 2F5-like n=1 Tax=Diceros bicornis minor TaxID=77932 RepID=UPI0026EB558B|nr:cytochrome P450 2F5-like [Diceros bicornis minor]
MRIRISAATEAWAAAAEEGAACKCLHHGPLENSHLTCLFLILGSTCEERLPPGPRPLPFVGNLLQLGSQNMLTSLMELSKKYGPVYTLYLGSRQAVVLSGHQAVKEALVDHDEDFSDWSDVPLYSKFNEENSIAFSNGNKWKILRKFGEQALHNIRMGKQSLEKQILEEVSFLMVELRKTEGQLLDPTLVLSRSLCNTICSVLFSSRFDYEDERLVTIARLLKDNFQINSSHWGKMYNLFPRLLDWLPGPHQRLFHNLKCLKHLITHCICEHQASFDPSSPRDFVDCFLAKMAQEHEDPLIHFNLETLEITTHNLLFSRLEPLGFTLLYAFLTLLKYPKVQARVQEETDCVVGCEQLPALEDRKAMPYMDAVIHEVQRFADIIPMNYPHQISRDTVFRGFLLPKGMDVITLLNTVHQDPSQFMTPQEFNPEHFLDANQSFKKSPAFMPFSAGNRMCLGKSLASMALFLYLMTILQSFSLQPLGAPEDIDLTPIGPGPNKIPRPFQMRLCKR